MSDKEDSISYNDFMERMDDLLGRQELYGDFIKSDEGGILYLALLLSLVRNLHMTDERYHRPYNTWTEVERFLENADLIPSSVKDRARNLFARYRGSAMLSSASRFSGPRNMLASLPAYHAQYNVWGQVSVLDLSLLDFELREPEHEPRMPTKWQERGSPYTVYIHGVRRSRGYVRLHCPRDFMSGLRVLRRGCFEVETEPGLPAEEYERLLDGVLAFETSRLSDWRLAHLRTPRGRISLGTDALVAQFIKRRRGPS